MTINAKLLVVDDEPEFVDLLRYELTRVGALRPAGEPAGGNPAIPFPPAPKRPLSSGQPRSGLPSARAEFHARPGHS